MINGYAKFSKILFSITFEIVDFNLSLLENHKNNDLYECVVSTLRI